jgi:hypothetical protein
VTGVAVTVGAISAGFTVTATALEAGDVIGTEALSVALQVITCEVPEAV